MLKHILKTKVVIGKWLRNAWLAVIFTCTNGCFHSFEKDLIVKRIIYVVF